MGAELLTAKEAGISIESDEMPDAQPQERAHLAKRIIVATAFGLAILGVSALISGGSVASKVQELAHGDGAFIQMDEEEDCFDHGRTYKGKTLDEKNRINSAHACQELCQGDAACEYFDWNPKNNKCKTKGSEVKSKRKPNFVSGPKNCPEADSEEEE